MWLTFVDGGPPTNAVDSGAVSSVAVGAAMGMEAHPVSKFGGIGVT